jgi:glutaredoxin
MMGRYHPKRLLFAALLLLLVYVHIRHSQTNEFYAKTVQALNEKTKDKAWKEETDAKVQKILDDKQPQVATTLPALVAPSHSAPRLPPSPTSSPTTSQDDTGKKDTPTRRRPTADKPKYVKDSFNSPSPSSPLSSKPSQSPDPPYLARVRAALDKIIRYHSIVIFSKTYCPHSRRAKSLLLESYDIVPKPYVVELDTLTEPADAAAPAAPHTIGQSREDERDEVPTMGRALQELLAQRTTRKTVPNIMVLGYSIGGADEVVKLDEEGALADKLKGMVGKRLERCEKRRASVQAAL